MHGCIYVCVRFVHRCMGLLDVIVVGDYTLLLQSFAQVLLAP